MTQNEDSTFHDNNNNNNRGQGGVGYGSIERQIKIVNYYDDNEEDVEYDAGIVSNPKNRRNPRKNVGGILLLIAIMFLLLYIVVGRIHHWKFVPFWSNPTNDNNDADSKELSPSMGRLMYYPNQLVNHFLDSTIHDNDNNPTWVQPYFVSETHFAGPGHPIFLILGGEGPVSGILYPFVSEGLAATFGAHVIQTEHRFYGNSQPISSWEEMIATSTSTFSLLSPEQALEDWIHILQYEQKRLGCDTMKTSAKYCPVITVGGSYPGFLSAMMRLNYPQHIDIAYASSAPLKLYEHTSDFDSNGYYDYVTKVADKAYPGCAHGVRSSLQALHDAVTKTTVHLDEKVIDNNTTANDDDNDVESSERNNVLEWAKSLGFCLDTVPSYIQSRDVLAEELLMLVVTSNADFNMDYYPPTNDTDLVKSCRIFADSNTPHLDRYRNFVQFKRELLSEQDDDNISSQSQQQETPTCFSWDSELPLGPNATLSTADWSGAGDGTTAQSWEFQICRDLVVQTGWGSKSMFVPSRQWSLQWLSDHCWSRFHIRPLPGRMQNLWHFDAPSLINRTSHILFTNGLQDGWSVSSYQTNLSKTILVLNFPNGAHHSDLSHEWPVPGETEDLIKGHESILNIVRQWLYEISKERGF